MGKKKNDSRYNINTFEETPVCFNKNVMGVDENIKEDFSIETTVDDIPNPDAYTFLVKIWVEEIEEDTKEVLWRGYVKNVIEKEKEQHFQDFDGLIRLILPYFQKLGINERENNIP